MHPELFLSIQFVPHSKHTPFWLQNQSANSVYRNKCCLLYPNSICGLKQNFWTLQQSHIKYAWALRGCTGSMRLAICSLSVKHVVRCATCSLPVSVRSHMNPVHVLLSCFFKIHFTTIYHLHTSLPRGLCPSVFPNKTLCAYPINIKWGTSVSAIYKAK